MTFNVMATRRQGLLSGNRSRTTGADRRWLHWTSLRPPSRRCSRYLPQMAHRSPQLTIANRSRRGPTQAQLIAYLTRARVPRPRGRSHPSPSLSFAGRRRPPSRFSPSHIYNRTLPVRLLVLRLPSGSARLLVRPRHRAQPRRALTLIGAQMAQGLRHLPPPACFLEGTTLTRATPLRPELPCYEAGRLP